MINDRRWIIDTLTYHPHLVLNQQQKMKCACAVMHFILNILSLDKIQKIKYYIV